MAVKEALILVGGKGTRLRSITNDSIPKTLAKIQNRPILEWELEWLVREGFRHAILATGHLSEKIQMAFGKEFETQFGSISLDYSIEREKLGSGGAVRLASELVTEQRVLVMNGDVLTDINLKPMKAIHKNLGKLATMLGVNMVSPYGIVHSENGLITKFEEKPVLDYIIHGGIDIIEKDVLERFPKKGQMEDTIFVELVEQGDFAIYTPKNHFFWMSIDTHKDFQTANEKWSGL